MYIYIYIYMYIYPISNRTAHTHLRGRASQQDEGRAKLPPNQNQNHRANKFDATSGLLATRRRFSASPAPLCAQLVWCEMYEMSKVKNKTNQAWSLERRGRRQTFNQNLTPHTNK